MKTPRTPFLAFLQALALIALVSWSLLVSPTNLLRAGSTPDTLSDPKTGQGELSREQLLERLGVTAWHRAGYKGQGLKIAILDTGFSGYREQLGKSLPKTIVVRSFRPDGNLEAKDSQHGILCGEVIHTIAPEAELLFANWDAEEPESFLAALQWAKEQGAKVVSCSVIMPTWSDGEGHGALHDSIKQILGEDVLLFASAGNTAQRHWSGTFHNDGSGWHEWAANSRWNTIRPWGSERVSVELCALPGADYELTVEDATAARVLGTAATRHAALRDTAAVRFSPQDGHAYRMKVRQVRGDGSKFHLVVLGGGLEYATKEGSIPFPADGVEVIAVGAVDAAGHRCAYSSCGPNSSQPKPDLVAIVPFPSSWRTRSFSGTSAAAPQAAALAALVWARSPKETAAAIRMKLREAVEHLGKAAHDCETGFGRIRLPDRE